MKDLFKNIFNLTSRFVYLAGPDKPAPPSEALNAVDEAMDSLDAKENNEASGKKETSKELSSQRVEKTEQKGNSRIDKQREDHIAGLSVARDALASAGLTTDVLDAEINNLKQDRPDRSKEIADISKDAQAQVKELLGKSGIGSSLNSAAEAGTVSAAEVLAQATGKPRLGGEVEEALASLDAYQAEQKGGSVTFDESEVERVVARTPVQKEVDEAMASLDASQVVKAEEIQTARTEGATLVTPRSGKRGPVEARTEDIIASAQAEISNAATGKMTPDQQARYDAVMASGKKSQGDTKVAKK